MSTTNVTVSAEDFAEARYRDDSDAMDAFLAYSEDAFDSDMTVQEWDDIADDLEDRYVGWYESKMDFVQDSVIDAFDVPFELHGYLDWESIALDWEIAYTIVHNNDGVWVWKN